MEAAAALWVAVASDQSLVTESVGAALRGRGFETTALSWSAVPEPGDARRPDVGLMLSELDHWEVVLQARARLESLAVPWLVLAGVPHGPAWGAVLDAGAREVRPRTTTLDEVDDLLVDVASGQLCSDPAAALRADDRRHLVEKWHEACRERDALRSRVSSLSTLEAEVLELLHGGECVRSIACRLEVPESMVHVQVRAVLRKLGVGSELAAVAACDVGAPRIKG